MFVHYDFFFDVLLKNDLNLYHSNLSKNKKVCELRNQPDKASV